MRDDGLERTVPFVGAVNVPFQITELIEYE
jgi:hypothetical protein